MGNGDWGNYMGIGDWAPIPNPQSPIKKIFKKLKINKLNILI